MKTTILTLVLGYAVAFSLAVRAQQPPADGPHYTNGTHLVRPSDYREWPFLGSGLGMTYDPAPGAQASRPQLFTNVFVNPSSHRSFMQTGKWPDKTVFVLEFRNAGSEASINKAGRFQTDLVALEAEVKDSRFPDGWAFFNFGNRDQAAPLTGSVVAACIDCHTKHTAVERTVVQFYPTLMEVARRLGTVKPGF